MEYLEIVYKQDVGYKLNKELYSATQELKDEVIVFKKKFSLKRMSEEREYCRQGKLKIEFRDDIRFIIMCFDGSKADADKLFNTSGFKSKVKMRLVSALVTFKRWSD